MMVDRVPAHLADMLRFTQELRSLAGAVPVSDFVANRVLCLAVEKLFINLGEAASRVGADAVNMPAIPWRRIIGLRNILAHGHEQVAHEILHETVVRELPALESGLKQLLSRY